MSSFSRTSKFSVGFLASTLLAFSFSSNASAEQPSVATVQSLTSGDRACYVELIDDNGQESTEFADFDICQQNIVGKRVRLTYESGNIIAESCQGDPACAQSETVMLITSVEAVTVSTPTTTIQNLPNGNYRYWNGSASGSIVSNETLLANGGILFTFRKQGNDITGIFGYVDGEAVCIQGRVNGNTVSGTATQTLQGASVLSSGESFANFGPSSALAVRRGRQLSRQQVRYSSALLNLGGLNRINAGTMVPPKRC